MIALGLVVLVEIGIGLLLAMVNSSVCYDDCPNLEEREKTKGSN